MKCVEIQHRKSLCSWTKQRLIRYNTKHDINKLINQNLLKLKSSTFWKKLLNDWIHKTKIIFANDVSDKELVSECIQNCQNSLRKHSLQLFNCQIFEQSFHQWRGADNK